MATNEALAISHPAVDTLTAADHLCCHAMVGSSTGSDDDFLVHADVEETWELLDPTDDGMGGYVLEMSLA